MAFEPMFGYIPPSELEGEARKIYEQVYAEALPFIIAAPMLGDTGKGKTVLLYKAQEKFAPVSKIRQDIGDCFVAGTVVLGEQIKPIEQVSVGDSVWTAEGRLTKVISTRKIQTDKKIVSIKALGGMSIKCTEDHRFLVYRMVKIGGKRVTRKLFERAEAGAVGMNCKAVVSAYQSREAVWVKAGELNNTDYLLTPNEVDGLPVPNDPFGFLSAEDGLFALGYFLGDGHASGGTVEIVVRDQEVERRICSVFIELGFIPSIENNHKGSCVSRIRVHSRSLVRWLRGEFYSADRSKNFPGWAIGNREFIDGIFEADGCDLKEDGSCIDTTSVSMAYGIFQTITCLGFAPSMREGSRVNCYANAKPLYRIAWKEDRSKERVWSDGKYTCRPVVSVDFLDERAVVYDIGVEDEHHSFLANGVGVHNCVGHGYARADDLLTCVEIALKGESESWQGYSCSEWLYGTSRVLVGGGKIRGDGSVGTWAAKAISEYGTMLRKKYPEVDLSEYSGSRAKEWGSKAGFPNQLVELGKQHLVRGTAIVRSYEEARDMIANGYPIPVCSNQGFSDKRDEQGFSKPKGIWPHCMLFSAVDDNSSRPGLLCDNRSWGDNWNSGPTRHEQPGGTFWVDAEVVDRMLKQNDSYALSDKDGYKKRVNDLDNRPW